MTLTELKAFVILELTEGAEAHDELCDTYTRKGEHDEAGYHDNRAKQCRLAVKQLEAL
jgi:hypothetical protein